jgi:uncharacterized membrane protein
MGKRPINPFIGVDEDRIYAFLSYLPIFCIISLTRKQENKFVQEHARQGVALFLCEFVAFLATIVFPSLLILSLFVFGILSLWGMLKSLKGERVVLPVMYSLSQRISL